MNLLHDLYKKLVYLVITLVYIINRVGSALRAKYVLDMFVLLYFSLQLCYARIWNRSI